MTKRKLISVSGSFGSPLHCREFVGARAVQGIEYFRPKVTVVLCFVCGLKDHIAQSLAVGLPLKCILCNENLLTD